MAIRALMEVIETSKNMEVAVMTSDSKMRFLEDAEIDAVIEQVNKEKEEAEAKKKK